MEIDISRDSYQVQEFICGQNNTLGGRLPTQWWGVVLQPLCLDFPWLEDQILVITGFKSPEPPNIKGGFPVLYTGSAKIAVLEVKDLQQTLEIEIGYAETNA